jgi:cytochrome P450
MSLPAQPSLSALTQTRRFLRDPFSLLEDAARERGPLFSLRLLGLGTWVFACSPELVKELFKAPPEVVCSGAANARMLGFMLGYDAAFSLDGDEHFQRRKLVHPLLNGRSAADMVPLMHAVAQRQLDAWPAGKEFRLVPWAHRFSLEILVRALFSGSAEEKQVELIESFDRFAADGLRSPLIMMPLLQLDLGARSPWGKVLELKRRTTGLIRDLVRERLAARADWAERDVAGRLANAKAADGSTLSEDAMVDELTNVIFAGHETTGMIISWTLESLARRPEALAKVRAELDAEVGDGGVTREHLPKLKYLDAVLNETMRFRPLAPMAGVRETLADFELGGYVLPKGTTVVHCLPLMAQNAELYQRPAEFSPEDHFLGRKIDPYEWAPFGGGRRMCLGRGLAEVELAVVVATLVRRGDLEVLQQEVKPVRDGIFFAPSEGLRVRWQPRSAT